MKKYAKQESEEVDYFAKSRSNFYKYDFNNI